MLSHHRSLFPYAVVALTLALAIFIMLVVSQRSAAPTPAPTQTEQVSDVAYQTEMKGILAAFDAGYAAEKSDVKRLALVEDTLSKLLSVRVPESEKSFHLEIAIALNAWRDALRSADTTALAAARAQYEKAYGPRR